MNESVKVFQGFVGHPLYYESILYLNYSVISSSIRSFIYSILSFNRTFTPLIPYVSYLATGQ